MLLKLREGQAFRELSILFPSPALPDFQFADMSNLKNTFNPTGETESTDPIGTLSENQRNDIGASNVSNYG